MVSDKIVGIVALIDCLLFLFLGIVVMNYIGTSFRVGFSNRVGS